MKPHVSVLHNRSRSVNIQWTHDKVCFEDHAFTYNLSTVTEAPGCSKTVLTNYTESVIDGLCSGTEYSISVFAQDQISGFSRHETYLKLYELPGFKRYESMYKTRKGGC